jgi:hypothetical protein
MCTSFRNRKKSEHLALIFIPVSRRVQNDIYISRQSTYIAFNNTTPYQKKLLN